MAQWDQGLMHGKGELEWRTGSVLKGKFHEGRVRGPGVSLK